MPLDSGRPFTCLFLEGPGRLWSLWEMLEAYGRIYWVTGHLLAKARGDLAQWVAHLDLEGGARLGVEDPPFVAAVEAFHGAKAACAILPFGTLGREIDRLVAEYTAPVSVDQIRTDLRRLAERFQDELEGRHFFPVPPEGVPFYGQLDLFGRAVSEAFPQAMGDIKRAGECYALHQPTACVFHLMRAMEEAVRKLGKRLGVTLGPQATWRKITGDMDHKISALPDKTNRQRKRKDDWREARANLHHVGQVWRNNTMHVARHYTMAQAKDVLDAVRVSMQSLAAL